MDPVAVYLEFAPRCKLLNDRCQVDFVKGYQVHEFT